MDDLIRISERKSFSDMDILALTEHKCVIRKYGHLRRFKTLREAWGRHRAMCVLIETRPGYGHWVSVFDRGGGTVEVFDAYGMAIDSQLEYVPEAFRRPSGQDAPHLTRLLSGRSVKRVVTNDVKLQRLRDDVATCGRWAGLRIALRDIPPATFVSLFIGQSRSPDWYAAALTFFI